MDIKLTKIDHKNLKIKTGSVPVFFIKKNKKNFPCFIFLCYNLYTYKYEEIKYE